MPKLLNRRHEWFAQLRAQGMRLEEAYEKAGYAPDRGHACRLASRTEVALRINEMRTHFTDIATAERPRVVDALMSIGESSRRLGTTLGLKEARFAYLEAARLHQEILEDLARDRALIEKELGRLTVRERRAKVQEPQPEPEPELELNLDDEALDSTADEARFATDVAWADD